MEKTQYPYVNHMNVLHNPLELIDIPSLVKPCTDQWHNQTLCQINDSVVRLGIVQENITGINTITLKGKTQLNCILNRVTLFQGVTHRTEHQKNNNFNGRNG